MKNEFADYTSKEAGEVLGTLSSDLLSGLTSIDAKNRLEKYGKNKLAKHEVHWWNVLFRQFKSPFIYLLAVAAILSIFLGHLTDGVMIFGFIAINTILGFYQEFKSEQTAKLLGKLVSTKEKVIRDGEEIEINSDELVPGDIVLLVPGDIVQADLRLVENKGILIDESVLTGESQAQAKTTDKLKNKSKEIFHAQNIIFAGTSVVSGRGKGVVIATGKQKEISHITKLATEATRESTFEKGIGRLSSFILKLIGATLILMFVANILIKGANTEITSLLFFTIALAVSVIPEALPVVTTFSLSRGALNLSRKKVVVKRLSAIEDLGSISVLCTDKTGTITENKMVLVDTLNFKKDLLFKASLASDFLNKNNHKTINSFDTALYKKLSSTTKSRINSYKKIDEIPFDPKRKRATILVGNGRDTYLVTRGAPENVAQLCTHKHLRQIEKWSDKQGKLGRRVMAVAVKKLQSEPKNLEKAEKDLTLVGLLSFDDPLKSTAKASIDRAKELGVEIKILTGDRKDVAGAIGFKVGLVDSPDNVITGEEFDKLPVQKKHEAVEKYSIFARVNPEQKYEIIKLIEEHHEVGFLGEGINDAPALKIANVGIVVSDASDIAKEAADILLLNPSLHTIINGIAEGRSVFANTVKYIKATLASNFGNFYAVATASLLISYLPLLPLQILLVNLLSDFPMISIATDSVDDSEIAMPKTYEIREIVFTATVLGIVSSAFDFITFATFFHFAPEILQTNWFMESILTELLLIYSIRTRKFFLKSFRKNMPSKSILILTIVAGGATMILPFTTFGANVFSFIKPTAMQFGIVIFISTAYLVSTEAAKLLLYKFHPAK